MRETMAPSWLRAFDVVFGLLALVLMLSFTFMFNGIARIVQGVTGTQETDVQPLTTLGDPDEKTIH